VFEVFWGFGGFRDFRRLGRCLALRIRIRIRIGIRFRIRIVRTPTEARIIQIIRTRQTDATTGVITGIVTGDVAGVDNPGRPQTGLHTTHRTDRPADDRTPLTVDTVTIAAGTLSRRSLAGVRTGHTPTTDQRRGQPDPERTHPQPMGALRRPTV